VRHLSERDLVHAQAGLGEPADRRHLESCLGCARRLQALGRDLAVITRTLGEAEPRPRPAPAFRRWVPAAAAASAMALAALLWIDVAVWRAVSHVPPTMRPEESRAMLALVSAALFSLGGDAAAASTDPVESLVMSDEDQGSECAGPDWLIRSGCGGDAS
jgi:hypothetical protein